MPEGISPSTMRRIRAAYESVTDSQYAEICARAKSQLKQLTRQAVLRAVKAASLDTTTQKVRSPLHDIDEGIRRSAGALLSRHNLMGIVIVAFTGPEDDPRCHSVAVDDWGDRSCV